MTFSREVLIIDGAPVIGEITVEAELQDGLPYFTVESFEPEDGRHDLLWSDVGPACEEWLRDNWTRLQEKGHEHK